MITFTQTFATPIPAGGEPVACRMARAMIELAASGQLVDEGTLVSAGYTRAEIAAHGSDAADLAIELNRAG